MLLKREARDWIPMVLCPLDIGSTTFSWQRFISGNEFIYDVSIGVTERDVFIVSEFILEIFTVRSYEVVRLLPQKK
jgi:hypothetical protein